MEAPCCYPAQHPRADTGELRWQTDADNVLPGSQPLADALSAAPVVAGLLDLTLFATRNASGVDNQIYAFNAHDGGCQFVVNGSCAGATNLLGLGQISGTPIVDTTAAVPRLFATSQSLDGTGDTVWSFSAEDGSLRWSHNLGNSDVSPAFADMTRTALLVANDQGQIYKLNATDGQSCWRSDQSGCGSLTGQTQVFCAATDSLALPGDCAAGSAVTTGFFTVWSGTHAGRLVFATADGFVRMIDAQGHLIWKSPLPISGVSYPLLVVAQNSLYVGSTDGHLHQLSLTDGTQTATQQVGDGTATVGSPVYDTRGHLLYVGSSDGTLYRYTVPF